MNRLDTARRYSLFLARNLDSGKLKPEIFLPMLDKVLTEADFQAFADWDQIRAEENDEELARQLRELRRYVVSQIIVRDINRISDLNEVTRTITLFADFAVNTALDFAYAYYRDMYGTPIGRYTKSPQHLSVVAMGKAGGYELNVSSDIDLIFVYPESGDTDGSRERGNQEFFTKVGQKLIALLNDITADGQVFRVDMRLRPDGDSGALVLSETALEQYLITQGREWERYAWCKGRVVTPYPNDIKSLVRPFVFRKYLDYSAYEAMRNLHRQIRSEVSKKGMADNIKLGAGGIREAEFTVQAMQMIYGGQYPALQTPSLLTALDHIRARGLMSAADTQALQDAYLTLRSVENALQYRDDQQTHSLPDNDDDSAWQRLATACHVASVPALQTRIQQARDTIHQHYTATIADEDTPAPDPIADDLAAVDWTDPDDPHLARWLNDNISDDNSRTQTAATLAAYTLANFQAHALINFQPHAPTSPLTHQLTSSHPRQLSSSCSHQLSTSRPHKLTNPSTNILTPSPTFKLVLSSTFSLTPLQTHQPIN